MKFTTSKIVRLFQAFTALDGAPRVVTINGQDKVVEEPYDLHAQARWNAIINRNKLRPFVEAHEDAVRSYRKSIAAFKVKQDPAADPKVNTRALAEEVTKVNDAIEELGNTEQDVEGLRKLKANGLNLRTSPIPVSVIEELLPLIDGDPDFDEPPKHGPASN
jgi:hypothetical protein